MMNSVDNNLKRISLELGIKKTFLLFLQLIDSLCMKSL